MRFLFSTFFIILLLPGFSFAEERDFRERVIHGKVLEVLAEEERRIPGTETFSTYQLIEVEILDGTRREEIVTFESDYFVLTKGDKIYINNFIDITGEEVFGVISLDRRDSLLVLVGVFVFVVIAFGGWQGVRSLVALGASFFAIFYILMPGILNGWNPLFASIAVATGVLFAAIFFTHGFNRESAVAYGGTMLAVILTGLFALFAVELTSLSGFANEEAVYLNFNTQGMLDFTALLLGAIIIGVLGVLDDIAVTQAAVVTEIFNSNTSLTRREVFTKALRIGREHVGALVNTLVLAYTGASLPLLLFFYLSPAGFGASVNSELFATEIVRTIVGSIGLILTVPIVTFLAVLFLKEYVPRSHRHSH